MKKLVKIFVVAAFAFGFGVTAQAQDATPPVVTNVTNTNISASAEVMAALVLVKDRDVNFGNISATTPGDIFLDPQEVGSSNIGTAGDAGKFTLTAATNQSVRFGWPLSIDLVNDEDADEKLVMTLAVSGAATDTQSSTIDLTLNAGGAVDVTTSAEGNYFLYVGGTIPQITGKATGTYSGTANFTVEYN